MLINVIQNFDVALSKISNYIKSHQPWYMDSGTIVHVIGSRENESQVGESNAEKNIKTNGGENHSIRCVGTSTVKTDSGEINMTNILYVSTLGKNLISIGTITDTRNIIIFLPHIIGFQTIFITKM